MPSHKNMQIMRLALSLAALLATPWAARAQGVQLHVRSATAFTQVFGDGQKLTAVILQYDQPVDGSKLSVSTFRVAERNVTKVYASTSAMPGSKATAGSYVVLELSPDDPAAALKVGGVGRQGTGPAPAGAASELAPSSNQTATGGLTASGGPPPGRMTQTYKPAVASVMQVAPVFTTGGKTYAPVESPIVTQAVKNYIVDDFKQLEFHDPKTGETMSYNLFMPKGYDARKQYPLVLFMPDASATGVNPLITLRQGLGAVIWASPEEQAKHPCFVLAPQFASQPVNNNSEATSTLETTIDLVEALAQKYSIDRKRLYNTGQSGGAMMSIAMDIQYPRLFAASFLVAGQWDPQLARPLASKKLWIVVSEGDVRAYPGENAMTAEWEKQGAKVSRAVWNGRSTPQQFSADVAKMEAEGNAINYVALEKGTVVPPGRRDDAGSNHMGTWPIAYTIEGIRDWLFQQHQ